MGYLDYSGLSHFFDKLKTFFVKKTDIMTGATSQAAGASGLVPTPAAGKNIEFLKGDGTWDSPALSELGLSVVNGKICVTYQKEVN